MALITVENNDVILEPQTASTIALFEKQMKYIKQQEDMLKQAIMEEMEAHGIIKIDTHEITISYIAQTDRETFDSKGFKADYPALYDDYVLIKPVKASIRIKVKDNG